MRIFRILAAGVSVIAVSGCGLNASVDTGPRVDRNFAVGGFTGIEVAGSYAVSVRTGAAPSVHANGSEKALDRLRVVVKNGVLEIGSQGKHGWSFGWGSWRHNGPVSLVVTVPSLESASIAGSGDIQVDKVSGPRFKGEVAGSGDLRLASVDAGEVSLEIAGSGNASAAGKAKNVRYEIAGSGDIDAAGLTAETAEVSIAGSGGIKGHASQTAKVDVAGSGDVTITGGAKCTVSKTGSGDIRCS